MPEFNGCFVCTRRYFFSTLALLCSTRLWEAGEIQGGGGGAVTQARGETTLRQSSRGETTPQQAKVAQARGETTLRQGWVPGQRRNHGAAGQGQPDQGRNHIAAGLAPRLPSPGRNHGAAGQRNHIAAGRVPRPGGKPRCSRAGFQARGETTLLQDWQPGQH